MLKTSVFAKRLSGMAAPLVGDEHLVVAVMHAAEQREAGTSPASWASTGRRRWPVEAIFERAGEAKVVGNQRLH
jgi:hypothetical protein